MTRTKEAKEKARAGKRETRYCNDCGVQGHIGVNCPTSGPTALVNEISWESEPEGENAEDLASLETLDGEEVVLAEEEQSRQVGKEN